MTDSNKSINLLRQRMIEDMAMRKLNPKTQSAYIRAVRKLAQYLHRSPDTATAEELRCFQLHLVELGVSSITLNATITGLRFFFEITVNRPDALTRMSRVYEPRKLPIILSIEEVTRLLEAAGGLKYKAALSVAYGAGLRSAKSYISKSATSTVNAWSFGSNKARVKRTAMPCSRRHCSSCYVPGIDMPAHSG